MSGAPSAETGSPAVNLPPNDPSDTSPATNQSEGGGGGSGSGTVTERPLMGYANNFDVDWVVSLRENNPPSTTGAVAGSIKSPR
ncbi:hypothetical protein CPLU01_00570 [Colletotrichum plurivorum]|uniref:Uncharacterized protein n=1 Tax=Colletotrichum plurivorum TaxID=2175906 RepID=A0A8H6U5H8_9PEZI|nr:hypothetical protein CPLU01_00570 [Colletotrichum plurivorum]